MRRRRNDRCRVMGRRCGCDAANVGDRARIQTRTRSVRAGSWDKPSRRELDVRIHAGVGGIDRIAIDNSFTRCQDAGSRRSGVRSFRAIIQLASSAQGHDMDAIRFDRLTRRLVLGGLTAGSLAALLGRDGAASKKKKPSKRKRCR